MAVDVRELAPSPKNLREGITEVEMSYFGVVYNAADNPVSLKLYIEPLAPLFFIENGNRTKILKISNTFSIINRELYKWQTSIEVTQTPDVPTACALRIEATDKHGYKSSYNSFIIYH